jgi:dynein heavy chain
MSVQVSDFIIPTSESSCQSFFLKMMLQTKVPVLFVGPTGTGKSAVVLNYLLSLPRDKFVPSVVNFTAWTSANQTQEIIMSKLDRYFTLLY